MSIKTDSADGETPLEMQRERKDQRNLTCLEKYFFCRCKFFWTARLAHSFNFDLETQHV